MNSNDNTGVQREIPTLEKGKKKKHGLFTGAAMFCAGGVVCISPIVGFMGLVGLGDGDGKTGIMLITLAAWGLGSALILGLLAEISMKLTTEYLDEED